MDNENIYDAAYKEAHTIEYVETKNNFEEEPKKKNKKGNGNGFAKYIAIALICSLFGGVVGSGATYAISGKNNSSEKSSSKVLADPASFATDNTALSAVDIYKKVAPAVVMVSTKTIQSVNGWFQQETEGMGSGFIINEDGYVVTNYHVINGAQEVKVIFSDGKEVNAKVVNYDAERDIAVIKITDDVKMPGIAQLGDSSTVKAGEEVIAIGNPLGKEFSSTVTKGIVSSPNRKMKTENGNVLDYIQTDAAINPGNSGGPLINSKGEVIGINTAKKVGEDIEGIGFAIPINEVKTRLGSLSKPILKLGITARTVTPELAKENKLEEGVYVVGVQEFSPAEKAGLKIGDLIVEFGGKRVKTLEELNQVKSQYNDGDSVPVEIIRDGKKVNLNLTLVAN